MSRRAAAAPEPYWRAHRRCHRDGRLEWYGEEPTEDFWGDLWSRRLAHDYFAPADRGDLQDLEEVLVRRLDRSGRHLEAGCGLGYWVAALRARDYDVQGLESSGVLAEVANAARPDLRIQRGDALAVASPDASFDGYLSFGVVEHRREGPEPFLAEAHRLLRPDGTLILSVPWLCPLRRLKAALGAYPGRPPDDVSGFFQYAFSQDEIEQLVRAAGFRVEEVHHQHVQRCLVEEVPGYFRLNRMRGARLVKQAVSAVVPPRLAGHMVLVVATRDRS